MGSIRPGKPILLARNGWFIMLRNRMLPDRTDSQPIQQTFCGKECPLISDDKECQNWNQNRSYGLDKWGVVHWDGHSSICLRRKVTDLHSQGRKSVKIPRVPRCSSWAFPSYAKTGRPICQIQIVGGDWTIYGHEVWYLEERQLWNPSLVRLNGPKHRSYPI